MTRDADEFWTDDDRDVLDVAQVINDENVVLKDAAEEIDEWGIDADERTVELDSDDEMGVERDDF